jgi:hypothetical protein
VNERPTKRHSALDLGTPVVVGFALLVTAAALLHPAPRLSPHQARPLSAPPSVFLVSDRLDIPPHIDPRLFALRSEYGFSPPDESLDIGLFEDRSAPAPWLLAKPAVQRTAPADIDPPRRRTDDTLPMVRSGAKREALPGEVRVHMEDTLAAAGIEWPSPPESLTSRNGPSTEATAWVACSATGVVLSVVVENSSGDAAFDRAVELWLYRGRGRSTEPASGRVVVEAPASIWMNNGARI